MSSSPVVVGVDDSADARSAVLWAAYEAVLARVPLLIVHSPQLLSPGTPTGYLEAALRASDDVGRVVLESSIALARAHEPDVAVSGLLSHAEPAQALVEFSATARLLVLGSRGAAPGEPSLLSSKRLLVSAHSYCPVLLLGPVATFSPPRKVSRVVVGAGGTRAGRAAVAFAAAEAARRQVELNLIRVANPSSAFGTPLDPDRTAGDPELELAEKELAEESVQLRRENPGLVVVTDLARGEAAEILPSYSDGRTILVVGCHHSDDHWSTRLGPVATSVVHRNRGPVIVVGGHGAPAHPRRALSVGSGHQTG